jgi:hypothetical protein
MSHYSATWNAIDDLSDYALADTNSFVNPFILGERAGG